MIGNLKESQFFVSAELSRDVFKSSDGDPTVG